MFWSTTHQQPYNILHVDYLMTRNVICSTNWLETCWRLASSSKSIADDNAQFTCLGDFGGLLSHGGTPVVTKSWSSKTTGWCYRGYPWLKVTAAPIRCIRAAATPKPNSMAMVSFFSAVSAPFKEATPHRSRPGLDTTWHNHHGGTTWLNESIKPKNMSIYHESYPISNQKSMNTANQTHASGLKRMRWCCSFSYWDVLFAGCEMHLKSLSERNQWVCLKWIQYGSTPRQSSIWKILGVHNVPHVEATKRNSIEIQVAILGFTKHILKKTAPSANTGWTTCVNHAGMISSKQRAPRPEPPATAQKRQQPGANELCQTRLRLFESYGKWWSNGNVIMYPWWNGTFTHSNMGRSLWRV